MLWIILSAIVIAILVGSILIMLPMCKEYDELMFPNDVIENVDVVADKQDAPKEEN